MPFLIKAFFLFAAALPAAAELPVEVYTIDRAMKSAVDNSALMQSAEKDIAIADQRVQEARFRFLPEIGLQASATRFQARYPFALRPEYRSLLLLPSDKDNLFSGQAYLSFPLYEGQRNINTLRLAQTALKQAQSNFDAVRLDLLYETQRVFYRTLLTQELLFAVEEFHAAGSSISAAANGNALDRLEAMGVATELRSERAAARHEHELARLEFLKGLNLELDRPVRLDGRLETSAVDVDLRKALVWATELRPELQAQTLKAQMDAIGVSLALSRRTPILALGVDYEITGQEFPLNQNNWDATVGIRIPFAFDFWTQHNQKVAEQRQAEIRRSELRDQVQLEVRKAHQDFVYWQEEWRQREAEHAELKALWEQVMDAQGRPADALRAAARVLAARKRHLEAVTEHILARARLERAVGRSLPSRP